MPPEFTPPTECPVCGDAVPRGAKSCPGCGADERTGWNEYTTRYDGLDLPDEAFDEADAPISNSPTHLIRNITIVMMIVALLFLFVF
jgi:predicted nucleic acid-binding Zn ribbon protein